MAEEIKEILDNLKINETTGMCYLSIRLTNQIRTIITNLQQENEELNRMCELYSKSLYNAELTDYKSRCKNATVILNNIYLLDDVSITNNAVIEIDKAINILQGSDEE